jgi:hypothetical protein
VSGYQNQWVKTKLWTCFGTALLCLSPYLAYAQQSRLTSVKETSELASSQSGDPLDALTSSKSTTTSTSEAGVQSTQALLRPSSGRSVVRAPVIAPSLTPLVRSPVATMSDPEPAIPIAARRRPAEEDPYAPLGVKLENGLILRPSIQQDVGYDSNPNRVETGKKGFWLSRSEAGLGVESDWSRHALIGQVRGAYTAFSDNPEADRPDADGRLALRLDVSRDSQINTETRFRVDTQRIGSPELNPAVRDRPVTAAYGASLGATQNFNRLQLGIRGDVDRFSFEDARLTSGAKLDQSDRIYSQYGARARLGYEVTPGFAPFVEGLIDSRVYDRSRDQAGFQRDSTSLAARAGSTFEMTRTLTGEAAAGYRTRNYEDERLRSINGVIADISLIWSASPITTFRIRAASEIEETSIAGASGAINRQVGVDMTHDFQRWLVGTAGLSVAQVDYQGIPLKEESLTARLGLEYRFTRELAARASFAHERLKSNFPGGDYNANVMLLGMRLQR